MDCLICSKKLKTSNLWAFTTVVQCFPGWGRWERLSPQYSSLSPPSSTAAPGWSLSLVRLVFVIGQVGFCYWSGWSSSCSSFSYIGYWCHHFGCLHRFYLSILILTIAFNFRIARRASLAGKEEVTLQFQVWIKGFNRLLPSSFTLWILWLEI